MTSMEMVLLDAKGDNIHAYVKKSLKKDFKDVIQEDNADLFENLLVALNDYQFKTTPHKFKLNFMGSTKCKDVHDDSIPKFSFDFMSFTDILGKTRENILLGNVLLDLL
ncbi:hypothetical protein JHK82_034353 [Glycine max]|nr:hypothetical protein JHK85_035061 [Glycine max]KAG4986731.1 hypothetical protein JHK86_034422 [Glycine max]KAG5119933.1 hypothetical protein JHK82_034353 [Glycine max]